MRCSQKPTAPHGFASVVLNEKRVNVFFSFILFRSSAATACDCWLDFDRYLCWCWPTSRAQTCSISFCCVSFFAPFRRSLSFHLTKTGANTEHIHTGTGTHTHTCTWMCQFYVLMSDKLCSVRCELICEWCRQFVGDVVCFLLFNNGKNC